MKKTFMRVLNLFVAILLFVLPIKAMCAEEDVGEIINLLTNGSFEQDALADGETQSESISGWTNEGSLGNFELAATDAADGRNKIRHPGAQALKQEISLDLDLAEDERLILEFCFSYKGGGVMPSVWVEFKSDKGDETNFTYYAWAKFANRGQETEGCWIIPEWGWQNYIIDLTDMAAALDSRITGASIKITNSNTGGEWDNLWLYKTKAGQYTYRFVDASGQVLKETTADAGSKIVPPNPQDWATHKDIYTCTGWEGYEEGMRLTKNAEFRAIFEKLATHTELMKNGGLEICDSLQTKPVGYNGFNEWNGESTITLVKAADNPNNVHSGNYAANITANKEEEYPLFSQRIKNIHGECKYRLSFWYRGWTDSRGMSVKFSENGGGGKEYYSEVYKTASAWTYVEFEFYAAKGTTEISIMPRVYGKGASVYFDDFSFMLVDGPRQFEVDSDWVFYYEDYDEATLTVTMNSFYADHDYSVDIYAVRGLQTISRYESLKFTDRVLVHKFDISDWKKKSEYNIKITVWDSDGEKVETITTQLYRYDRPKALNGEGIYIEKGQPFTPVIAYHIGKEDWASAREAGINVVQWLPTGTIEEHLAELDYMQSIGMKAAVVCYWSMKPAGDDTNIDRISEWVKQIYHHPAIFCYMVMDEPFAHYANREKCKELLRKSYKMLRDIDDVHPVYIVDNVRETYGITAKYVDCLAVDVYAAGRDDFPRLIGERTEEAREAVKYEKPVYSICQAFSYGGVTPTGEMLSHQLYQIMMSGAQGYGYYTWKPDDPEVDDYLDESRYWNDMVAFYEEALPVFTKYFDRREDNEQNSCRDDDIWYQIRRDGQSIYVAVINRSNEDKQVTIPVTDNGGNGVTVPFVVSCINGGGMSSVTMGSGNFTVDMKKHHSSLYKITPAVAETGEILILNERWESISKPGDASEQIVACAGGLDAGDRLFLAAYRVENQEKRLVSVTVVTAEEGKAICSTKAFKECNEIVAYVWKANMLPQSIKLIEQ